MSNLIERKALKRHYMAVKSCGHTELYDTGYCADCGEPIPDFEPSDIQIFTHYGQTKETAA